MADYWALSSSNWSNLSNWLTGVSLTAGALPGPFDDVYANGRVVNIDINPTVNLITTRAGTNIFAGGGFNLNNGVTLSANFIQAGTTTCLTFLSAAPNSCTIFGNVSGGTGTSCMGITNNSNGSIRVIGNIIGGPTGSITSYGINNASTGTVFVTGNVFGSSGDNGRGIHNNSSGTLFVEGSVVAGLASNRGNGIWNQSGWVNIIGNVISNLGGAESFAIWNFSSNPVNILGNIIGGVNHRTNLAHSGGGIVTINGNIEGSINVQFGGTLVINGEVRFPYYSNSGNMINNQSSGTVLVSGSIGNKTIGTGGVNGTAINNSNIGTVQVIGNINSAGGGASNNIGISNSSTGSVFITGNVTGGSGSNDTGIINSGLGQVIINGNTIGGSGSSSDGVRNSGNGIIIINGNSIGGPAAVGCSNTNQGSIRLTRAIGNSFGLGSSVDVPAPVASIVGISNSSLLGACYVEEISAGRRGVFPTSGPNIYITRKSNNQATYVGATSAVITTPVANSYIVSPSAILLFSSLTGGGTFAPRVSNVRFGTSYDFNSQVGTCFIPDRRTVIAGVSVDNTTGTFFSELGQAWNTRMINVSTANTFGVRLKNIITLSAANATWALSE